MKINALYVYDVDQECVFIYSNLARERVVFNEGTRDEQEKFYATHSIKKVRVPINQRSGQVYTEPDKNRYILWLHNPSKKAALMIFEEYILTTLSSEIEHVKQTFSQMR